MPIKDPSRYPSNWKQIRAQILERAGHCCEGSPAYPDCRVPNYAAHPVTGSKVVLTIAHLDHTPEHNDPENLRAWCQRCHNKYDAPFRALNRKLSRVEKILAELQRLTEDYENEGLLINPKMLATYLDGSAWE